MPAPNCKADDRPGGDLYFITRVCQFQGNGKVKGIDWEDRSGG